MPQSSEETGVGMKENSVSTRIKNVSIIISLYNEEENIQKLFEELYLVEQSLSDVVTFEYICVNDGSSDHTLSLLMQEMKHHPNIKIFNFYRNFGHEIAMTAGMDQSGGDAVIFMDGDLQHPPRLIKEMVYAWLDGYKVVLTQKITKDTEKSFTYKLLSSAYYYVLNRLSDFEIPKDSPDFRLLDREEVEVLKKIDEHDRMFRGMLNFIGYKNYKIIPFEVPKRFAGESKYNYRKSFRLAMDSIMQFSTKPLKVATYLGVISIVLATILGVDTLIEYLFYNHKRTGYATTMIVILFMSSIQFIILGIIGAYIGKIHIEVKKRPLYFGELIEAEKLKEHDA